MTRERFDNLFSSAFHLTELQCILQNTLTLPLQGCPTGTYLELRARLRDCLASIPFDLDANRLKQSVREGLKIIEPRPCFTVDLRGHGEFRDSREAYQKIASILKENERTPEKVLRLIRSRSYFDADTHNRRYWRFTWLMWRSQRAARKLDHAMGAFRKQKAEADLESFCCFTAGWALGAFASYGTALARFAEFVSPDHFPSEKTLFMYRGYLLRLLSVVDAFLDQLILRQWVEALACLSSLRCIVATLKADPEFKGETADLVSRIANEALAQRGLKPLFRPIMQELAAMYSETVRMEETDGPDSPAWRYRLSALDAKERYFVSYDIADLNRAIALAEKALDNTQPNYRQAALHQELLSLLLFLRFEQSGIIADVDSSITRAFAALEGFQSNQSNHPMVPTTLANLGRMLTFRFERTGSSADIEMAIEALELTVDRAAGPCGPQVYWWANLANALRLRFNQTDGAIGDLDEAIQLYEKVLKATPASWPERATLEVNLSNTVFDRQRAAGDIRGAFIDEKVELARAAIGNLRDQPRELARTYRNLGLTLRLKGVIDPRARSQSVEAMRAAVMTGMNVSAAETLDAAVNWGDLALLEGAWEEAVEAYGHAFVLAEQQFRVQLTRAEQIRMLDSAQGLAANAAFALVRVGRVQDAVVYLEAGLGRMLADGLEKKRNDLGRLRDSGRGDLLERYENLAQEIAALSSGIDPGGSTASSRLASRPLDELRGELEDVITDIREVPGFAEFLKELTFEQILAASDGCLVYVVATDVGGLGLIVRSDSTSVRAVELADLNAGWLRETVRGHWSHRGDGMGWQTWLDALLTDLGSMIMEQLLDAIGDARRATIVPVGLLQLLPLHAALVHGEAKARESVRRRNSDMPLVHACDRLAIAYAPNARALVSRPSSAPDKGVLLVQNSDGGKLRWTALEAELIRCYSRKVTAVADDAATLNAVLDQIRRPSILHFSSHGSANMAEPLRSGLVLAEGDVLTVRHLMDAGPLSARLAVLAACESGAAGFQLPDEIISLPTAFLQSGIPSVIATLWPIGDLPAALIVGRFYHNLQRKGMTVIDAFLEAQRWLRTSTWMEFERFVREAGCSVHELRGSKPGEERPYRHPAFWAPFYWTGSHI